MKKVNPQLFFMLRKSLPMLSEIELQQLVVLQARREKLIKEKKNDSHISGEIKRLIFLNFQRKDKIK